jgi:hypothetical protein
MKISRDQRGLGQVLQEVQVEVILHTKSINHCAEIPAKESKASQNT